MLHIELILNTRRNNINIQKNKSIMKWRYKKIDGRWLVNGKTYMENESLEKIIL
jgi:hypothetical protein